MDPRINKVVIDALIQLPVQKPPNCLPPRELPPTESTERQEQGYSVFLPKSLEINLPFKIQHLSGIQVSQKQESRWGQGWSGGLTN